MAEDSKKLEYVIKLTADAGDANKSIDDTANHADAKMREIHESTEKRTAAAMAAVEKKLRGDMSQLGNMAGEVKRMLQGMTDVEWKQMALNNIVSRMADLKQAGRESSTVFAALTNQAQKLSSEIAEIQKGARAAVTTANAEVAQETKAAVEEAAKSWRDSNWGELAAAQLKNLGTMIDGLEAAGKTSTDQFLRAVNRYNTLAAKLAEYNRKAAEAEDWKKKSAEVTYTGYGNDPDDGSGFRYATLAQPKVAKYSPYASEAHKAADEAQKAAEGAADATAKAAIKAQQQSADAINKAIDDVDRLIAKINETDGAKLTVDASEVVGDVSTETGKLRSMWDKFTAGAANMWHKFTAPAGEFSAKADDIRAKIAKLKTEMAALAAQKTPTAEYKALLRNVEAAKAALDRYTLQQDKMATMGVDKESARWKSLQYDIDEAKARLQAYAEQLEELSSNGGTFTTGDSSGKSSRMASQLAKYEAQLSEVSAKGTSMAGKLGHGIGSAISSGFNAGFEGIGRLVVGGLKGIANGAKSAISHFTKFRDRTVSLDSALKKAYRTFTRFGAMLRTRITRTFVSVVFEDLKSNVGNMARISDEFNGAISGMVNSCKALGAQIVAIAEPIIRVLAPIVQRAVDMLTAAADKAAQFTARLTGNANYFKASKGNCDFAASLDTTGKSAQKATKATKEYQNTVLGFDQLNKLNGTSNADAAAITGVSDAQLAKAETQATALNGIADRIHDALTRGDFKEAGKTIGEGITSAFAWVQHAAGWKANGEKLTGFLRNTVDLINGITDGFDGATVGRAIGDVVNSVIESAKLLSDPESGFDFSGIGANIGETVAAALEETNWDDAGSAVVQWVQGFVKMATATIKTPGFMSGIGKALRELISGAVSAFEPSDWAELFGGIVNGISDALIELGSDPKKFGEFGKKLAETVSMTIKGTGSGKVKVAIKATLDSIWAVVSSFFNTINNDSELTGKLREHITNITAGMAEWLADNADSVSETVFDTIYKIFFDLAPAAAKGLWDGMKDSMPDIINGIGTGVVKSSSKLANKAIAWIAGDSSMAEQVNAFIDNDMAAFRDSVMKYGGINAQAAKMLKNYGLSADVTEKDMAEMWLGADPEEVYNYFARYNEVYAQEMRAAVAGNWQELGALLNQYGSDTIGSVVGLVQLAGDDALAEVKAVMNGSVGTVADSLKTCTDSVADSAPKITDTLRGLMHDITGLDWTGTGSNIAAGISDGISSGSSGIGATLINAVTRGIVALKNYLGIHSPSTLLRDEIGQYMPKGIAVGIDENTDAITDSMHNVQRTVIRDAGQIRETTRNDGATVAAAHNMRDAMIEALMAMQGSGNGGGTDDGGDIIIEVDSEELARATMRGRRKIDRRQSPTVTFA